MMAKSVGGFGKPNKEKMKAQAAKLAGITDDHQLKKGRNIIRFLPPKAGSEDWYKEIRVHYGVGPEKEFLTCPSTIGKPCPLCQRWSKLLKDGVSKEDARVKELGFNRKYVTNALNVDDLEKGVKSCKLGRDALRFLISSFEDEEYGDITDPETGRNVQIVKSGTGIQTRYDVSLRPKATSLKAILKGSALTVDDVGKQMQDLDALVAKDIKSYAEIKNIWEGDSTGGEDEEDESAEDDGEKDVEVDEDEAPKKKKGGKAEPEDEDDEDDEDDEAEDEDSDDEEEEEDEDEEDSDSDDEDEDEEEDDEDEEEDDEDEEEDDEDEEEDDEDEEEDEEEDDEEEDDEEEDDEDEDPPPKKGAKKKGKK
jgi:hypothetical protein